MSDRLLPAIRHYAEDIDADARPVEELLPPGLAEELGTEPYPGSRVPRARPPRPTRSVPRWAWAASALAVLLLSVPSILWLRSPPPDSVADTPVATTPATAAAPEGAVRNPENGHVYEVVAVSSGITWNQALEAAAARSFDGVQGHLATFTSAAEYQFVVENLPEAFVTGAGRNPYWLGGFQTQPAAEPGGDWVWVTGEPFSYTNWASGEPNDSVANENCLHPHHSPDDAPRWNDQPCDDGTVGGYIVEYSR